MSVFNFYVDTSTIDDRNKAEIILDTPIQTQPNEYLEVKVIDVSLMNDNYNISSSLNNNQFTIERKEVYYQIIPSNPKVLTPIINVLDFYQTEAGNNLNQQNTSRDDADGYEFIRNTDNIIYFYDLRILEGDNNHLINNIFDNVSLSQTIRLSETYDTHFVIENREDDNYDFLDSVEVSLLNDGSAIATNTTFTFSVSFSNDNETYTDFSVSNNTITFPANPTPNSSVRTTSITINHTLQPHAYKYYRLKFVVDNAVITDTGYEWVEMRMIKNSYTITPSETIYNEIITLPDGFYNSTNFLSTINTSLTSYNIILSLDTTTNKILFSNTNPAVHTYHSYDDIEENNTLKIILDNNLLKRIFGFINTTNELPKNTITTADNPINLLHYQKLVLTTDLTFNVPTTHLLKEWKEDKADGMRNILLWVPVDDPPYTIIKYKNYEGISYRINDSYIKNLNFYFYNEFKQSVDINRLLFHIQIIKKNISYY